MPTQAYLKQNLLLLNNNISTLNILWSIKKFGKKGIKFINTSTTGVYGQPNFKIPEGFIEAKYQKKKISFHSLT